MIRNKINVIKNPLYIFIGTLIVSLKLVADLVMLPSNFESALGALQTVESEYAIDYGRTQLDGSRPARLRYYDLAGSKQLVPCKNQLCDQIPSFGKVKVRYLKVAVFIPTTVVYSTEINGKVKIFPDSLSNFKAGLLAVLFASVVGTLFAYLFWKGNSK